MTTWDVAVGTGVEPRVLSLAMEREATMTGGNPGGGTQTQHGARGAGKG